MLYAIRKTYEAQHSAGILKIYYQACARFSTTTEGMGQLSTIQQLKTMLTDII